MTKPVSACYSNVAPPTTAAAPKQGMYLITPFKEIGNT